MQDATLLREAHTTCKAFKHTNVGAVCEDLPRLRTTQCDKLC